MGKIKITKGEKMNITNDTISKLQEILDKNKIDVKVVGANNSGAEIYTNIFANSKDILKTNNLLNSISNSDYKFLKSYLDDFILKIHQDTITIDDFEYLNKRTKRFGIEYSPKFSSNGQFKRDVNKISHYSKYINKLDETDQYLILKYFPECIRSVIKPSKYHYYWSFLTKGLDVVLKDRTLSEELQIHAIANDGIINSKNIKNITPKARIAFIIAHPERIGTPNNFKLEELSKQELEIFKKEASKKVKEVKSQAKNNSLDVFRNKVLNEFHQR